MKIERLVVGPIETNCYLLEDSGELGLIDPGDEAEKIIEKIKDSKAKLKKIILTHTHPDHVEALESVQSKLGGEVLVHTEEEGEISVKNKKALVEGDIIKIGKSELKVIHTPGHTPGSFCLLAEYKIFTGDTLFLNGCGRTDLPGGDWQALEKSLVRLEQIIKPGFEVLPGHGETFQV
jgi:glyoxylase-like metal-dependent hydrolase (beta-lactamase superfamily II)